MKAQDSRFNLKLTSRNWENRPLKKWIIYPDDDKIIDDNSNNDNKTLKSKGYE